MADLTGCPATCDYGTKILPLREQARVMDEWLSVRLDTVLPKVMSREGFDMWIVVCREYNEDPVLLTLLPATIMSARRRTILVFSLLPEGGVERLIISRPGSTRGSLYKGVWDSQAEDQWEALRRVVRERDPKCIGINTSETFAFGDGLSYVEHGLLAAALGPVYMARTKGAERLAIGWLEERTEPELNAYPGIVQIAHGIVAEAFSSRVVHPGITTAADVGWWMRQRMSDMGLRAWFHSDVMVQRRGAASVRQDDPILPGDVLHCDMGFHYLGLATDVQQMAYVLRRGEVDAPFGLKAVLAAGNRLQDIHAGEYVAGRTGNEILAATLEKARAEGLCPCVYSHPIGFHGHGAGPTIGLYDQQEGVPGRGDYELRENTCYAMELNVKAPVDEWDGQTVMMALEEDVVFTEGRVHFLSGRQRAFHLIQ
ncbi:MAG: M24 family metallopeptidase [Bacillota bacterium]